MGTEKVIGTRNRLIHFVLDIISNRKPNPRNLFVAEGIWAHQQVKDAGVHVESFLVCPELIYSDVARSLVTTFSRRAERQYRLSPEAFRRLAERDRPDGLISICRMPIRSLADLKTKGNSVLVILDGLAIPGNVGTIIRTVDGAGGSGVVICNKRTRLTHPKVIKASHGTCFRVPVIECTLAEIISWLKKNNSHPLIADANHGVPYYGTRCRSRIAMILGNERYGASKNWYTLPHTAVTVPMKGSADSLNVAVAGSIILYDLSAKLDKVIVGRNKGGNHVMAL